MHKSTKTFKSIPFNLYTKNYLNIKSSKYIIGKVLRKYAKYVLILHFNQKNRCQKPP